MIKTNKFLFQKKLFVVLIKMFRYFDLNEMFRYFDLNDEEFFWNLSYPYL